MNDEANMVFIAGYTKSIFQDFENYRRTEVDFVEETIKLVFSEQISNFITCNSLPLFTLLRTFVSPCRIFDLIIKPTIQLISIAITIA